MANSHFLEVTEVYLTCASTTRTSAFPFFAKFLGFLHSLNEIMVCAVIALHDDLLNAVPYTYIYTSHWFDSQIFKYWHSYVANDPIIATYLFKLCCNNFKTICVTAYGMQHNVCRNCRWTPIPNTPDKKQPRPKAINPVISNLQATYGILFKKMLYTSSQSNTFVIAAALSLKPPWFR